MVDRSVRASFPASSPAHAGRLVGIRCGACPDIVVQGRTQRALTELSGPVCQAQWNLNPAIVTLAFATYQVSLIVVLLLFGNPSDRFGRRVVMIWGIGPIAASAVVFAFAPNVMFLFAGHLLQGAGSGLAMGAATASLVENNISRNPQPVVRQHTRHDCHRLWAHTCSGPQRHPRPVRSLATVLKLHCAPRSYSRDDRCPRLRPGCPPS